MKTYGMETESTADGWEISWPRESTEHYGLQAVLAFGSGQPTQRDYDKAWMAWVLGNMAGALPPPLGAPDALDVMRMLQSQNAPSSEAVQ